jgi:pimeloyl-ACP methyl ester carboxylesterase
MRIELVSIPTETVPLDGAWYEPEGGPARGAVLIMHGNQGNFYVGPPRFLPPALAELGFASLAFNRRGHDILGTYRGRDPVGGALQTTREQVEDDDSAAAWLRERGFEAPVVIGHSHGGLLAAQHAARHPETPALVLLSAAGGGRQATRIDSAAGLLLRDRYDEIVERARRLVDEGRGRELILLPGWWWVISAESLCDRLDAIPDLLALAPEIHCPALFLKGQEEPEAAYPARAFAAACSGPCELVELAGCDHWYNGRDQEVADAVAGWLAERLQPA